MVSIEFCVHWCTFVVAEISLWFEHFQNVTVFPSELLPVMTREHVQGEGEAESELPWSGKNRFFFKVREKSGNFVSSQGI